MLQSYLIRSYQYVIARYDIDGFRIDTLRYLQGGCRRPLETPYANLR